MKWLRYIYKVVVQIIKIKNLPVKRRKGVGSNYQASDEELLAALDVPVVLKSFVVVEG